APGWSAMSRWTPAGLATRLGTAPVEVMMDRSGSGPCEMDSAAQRVTVAFADLAAAVEGQCRTRELYLVGNNQFLENEPAKELWDDFSIDERYLDKSRLRARVCFWMGPKATVTPLHHDVSNILFCQIVGRK